MHLPQLKETLASSGGSLALPLTFSPPSPQPSLSHSPLTPHPTLISLSLALLTFFPPPSYHPLPTSPRFFNTNNLWVHLPQLKETLASSGGSLALPLIKNKKTVNPRDPKSAPVFQLETAMGSAIECFGNAGVCRTGKGGASRGGGEGRGKDGGGRVGREGEGGKGGVRRGDPRDPKSAPVLQLEKAMGSEIECFGNAGVRRRGKSERGRGRDLRTCDCRALRLLCPVKTSILLPVSPSLSLHLITATSSVLPPALLPRLLAGAILAPATASALSRPTFPRL